VYIDELVLHGFAPGDRYSIGEAVERELARLYGECGVSASLMHHIQGVPIDAGAFNLAPGSTADAIGVQVAQALYKGLTP